MSARSSQRLRFLIILLIESIYFKEPLHVILNIAGKENILSQLPLAFIHKSFYRGSVLRCAIAQREEMLLTLFHLIYSICHYVLCAKNGLLFKFVYAL